MLINAAKANGASSLLHHKILASLPLSINNAFITNVPTLTNVPFSNPIATLATTTSTNSTTTSTTTTASVTTKGEVETPRNLRQSRIGVKYPSGRTVILGTGWGGFSFLKKIVFTPLLPSASVGTLEFRCITEPVRELRPNTTFYQATCKSIDFKNQTLYLSPVLPGKDKDQFIPLSYDSLVIACGAVSNTFGIKGVEENAFFLKQINDARRIRQRIIECFEYASEPGTTEEEIQNILTFAVVGAGPTGVEFSGEYHIRLCSK